MVKLITGPKQECLEYLNNVYNKDFDINWLNNVQAACYDINGVAWVYIDVWDVSIQVLTHELTHAVFLLFKKLGLDLADEEAFCYLLEYLLDQTIKYIPYKITPVEPKDDE